MKADPRDTKPTVPADREQAAPGHDARKRRRERQRRIGAAQLAAPSTRTWRRAGRFV